jgi:glycogen operon protein
MTSYLRRLGVTAVELMPVHQFVPELHVVSPGLPNYWGYNTIGYFAPHNGYAATAAKDGQVDEFKAMVKALHEAGIEVLIDVVYNHTGEGAEDGPTVCFRGIDNAAYYRLRENNPRHNVDFSGCGNCVRGRIVFHTVGGDIELGPRDKMVLPPHTPHAATVGAEGVRCIEAPRQQK